MHMGRFIVLLSALGPVAWASVGVGDEPFKKDASRDYTELSRLIHKVVAGQVPKAIEDNSGWGKTIPIPEDLKLPKLRTVVKVGDRMELPHGLWRKVKLTMPDPAKDLNIRVKELSPMNGSKYRLKLEADANLHGWTEVQHWQKGLALVGFIAEADAAVLLNLECEVGLELNSKKFPPEIKIDPKVTGLEIDLKDFSLRKVTLRRLGTVLEATAPRKRAISSRASSRACSAPPSRRSRKEPTR
jgi:hypothetical protein